jgi:uroporphyrinogen decarboxylase
MPSMTPKDRVLTTLACGVADRVPVNYAANAGIDRRLKEHFGLEPWDHNGLRDALGVDFRGVAASYDGPKLHGDDPSRGVVADNWGIRRRWVEHGTGGYWDYCDFPLSDADEETVAEWPMPDPEQYDYSAVRDLCETYGAYCVFAGGAGLGDIINSCGMLRGMEQVLVDLATDDPAGLLLARRRTEINLEIMRRTLEAAEGGIDFLWMGEDLGTQRGPLISVAMYRRHIRPLHQQVVDLAKSFDLPVMIHTCGSSSWAYDDFIAMGIDAVDTLQPEAENMSPEYLKKTFGGRLAFHGCISTAGPVSFGTPDEVRQDCRNILDIMMPGGGYCFAPTHQLQDNSPTENVLAMYETARDCGVY